MTGALSTHLWQSTWFALAVGLLTLVYRRNRAHVRSTLWLCASIKFLVPFAPLIDAARQLGPPAPAPAAVERIAITLADPAVLRAPVRVAAAAPRPLNPLPILWACGFAAIVLHRLRGWRRVRAALRASRPVDLAVGARVRSAPGLLEPGVVGVLRPVLLLPEGIVERLPEAQLAAVLSHEICHIRRRDNLAAAVHMVVEAVFWFHPLVWWIGARMVEERERACDEGVLSSGNDAGDYAAAILGVCKLYVESPLACVSGVTGANLKLRIEAIMSNRIGEALTLAKRMVLLGAGAAALAGPIVMGVVIGAGHLPLLNAQQLPMPPSPQPQSMQTTQDPQPVQTAQAAQTTQTTQPVQMAQPVQTTQSAQPLQIAQAVQTTQRPQSAEGRWISVLFDTSAMTGEELTRAQDAAIRFVADRLQPGDHVSILQASDDKVRVIQDYISDPGVLQGAIARVTAPSGPSVMNRAQMLEQTANLLAPISQKKVLIYFSHTSSAKDDQADIMRAVIAARFANVAFYPVDVRFPPPVATFQGNPDAAGAPSQALNGPANVIGGLPARHMLMETYHANSYHSLIVPLDNLEDRVDIVCEIRRADGSVVANLRDALAVRSASLSGAYHAKFKLDAGSYIAKVLVREQSTGRMFAESISFEVK